MTIQVPLSLIRDPEQFRLAVEDYRKGLEDHAMGKPGRPRPSATPLIEAVIKRQPQDGPVAIRGPDQFVIMPYTIIDDTPRTPEQQRAIETLRHTIIK